MTAESFDRALRAFVRRTPFKPFLVELVSGAWIGVDHPESLVFRAGSAVHIDPQGEYTLFDHERVSQLRDVQSAPSTGES